MKRYMSYLLLLNFLTLRLHASDNMRLQRERFPRDSCYALNVASIHNTTKPSDEEIREMLNLKPTDLVTPEFVLTAREEAMKYLDQIRKEIFKLPWGSPERDKLWSERKEVLEDIAKMRLWIGEKGTPEYKGRHFVPGFGSN